VGKAQRLTPSRLLLLLLLLVGVTGMHTIGLPPWMPCGEQGHRCGPVPLLRLEW